MLALRDRQAIDETRGQVDDLGKFLLLLVAGWHVALAKDLVLGRHGGEDADDPALVGQVALSDAVRLPGSAQVVGELLDQLGLGGRSHAGQQPQFLVLGAPNLSLDHGEDVVLCRDGGGERRQVPPVPLRGFIEVLLAVDVLLELLDGQSFDHGCLSLG